MRLLLLTLDCRTFGTV